MEDHDFGVRLRGLGNDILAVPEAHVLHGDGADGLSLRKLGKYSSLRVYCLIRNRWLFILKHYSPGEIDPAAVAGAAAVRMRADRDRHQEGLDSGVGTRSGLGG